MTSFEYFRQANKRQKVVQDRLAAKFILDGYSATKIIRSNKDEWNAAVVWHNDTISNAYVFTELENKLSIGEVISINNERKAIVIREDYIVKKVDYHKYLVFECNCQIDDQWGWFKGSGETYISTNLIHEKVILSNAKPMIILPGGIYEVGDKVLVNGRPWLIIEYDNTTTPGLTYYSLEATRYPKKENDSTLLPPEDKDELYIKVKNDEEIVLNTERAYFSCQEPINILRRDSSTIRFSIPFGIEYVKIEVLENGAKKEYMYKAVL